MKKSILTVGALALGLAAVTGAVWAATDGPGPGAMRGQMMGQMTGKGSGMQMRGQMMGQIQSQMQDRIQGHQMQGHGPRGGDHGMGGMLHGGDATAAEVGDIHDLFDNHESIARTVTNLPNGIKTVTESDDPKVAQTIKTHVADMLKRVSEKRDPGLPIESPALRAIFENYDKITTEAEMTEKGVIVTQTSDDAATVALLQKHAGEVTAFVNDGAEAAHMAMMERMHGAGGRNRPSTH